MRYYRWKLIGLIGMAWLIAAQAVAQPGCFGDPDSFELVVLRAEIVGVGTVAGFELGSGYKCENCRSTSITITVTETLKGTHYDRLSVPFVRLVGDVEQLKEHGNRLFFAISPQGKPTVYNLDEPALALPSSNLIFLRSPEQAIAAAKEEILRSGGSEPNNTETFVVRMPDKEIAQLGWHLPVNDEMLQAQGSLWCGGVTVPVDERLEQKARELIRSDDPDVRARGVHALKFFKSDAPLLIPLLHDPASEKSVSAEDNNGVEVREYPVRQAAFDVLSKEWGMNVTPGVLREEIPQYETIERITWKGPVTDEGLTKLVDLCQELKSLSINENDRPLTDAQFALIREIKTLTTLGIWGRFATDVQLAQLVGFKNLERLDLRQSKITGNGLQVLTDLPNLKSLILSWTQTQITELSGLKNTNLELLDLSHSSVTDNDLLELGAQTNLKSLDLGDTRITDNGLQELAALPNLKSLDLSHTRITRLDGSKNKNLEQLDLSSSQVTDSGLKRLGALPNLRSLDLDNTQITDDGLPELSSLANLESLNLSGTQVTDNGVQELAALPNLKSLGLAGRVTGEGISEMRRRRPDLFITGP